MTEYVSICTACGKIVPMNASLWGVNLAHPSKYRRGPFVGFFAGKHVDASGLGKEQVLVATHCCQSHDVSR